MEGDRLIAMARGEDAISTHALTWRATRLIAMARGEGAISTHALTWRATSQEPRGAGNGDISTHALTWRATFVVSVSVFYHTFLPTPSHGGRRPALRAACRTGQISTHALTWRATGPAGPQGEPGPISTHALTWRATGPAGPQGEPGPISTHALTWRATRLSSLRYIPFRFLPTPSHGGRLAPVFRVGVDVIFLPTPSHGGRRPSDRHKLPGGLISTHALTWRATVAPESLTAR